MEVGQVKQMITRAISGVRHALRGMLIRAEGNKQVVILQMGGVSGEVFNDAELFQQPGFRSIPLEGMQPIIVPLNGSSANGVVVAMSNGKLFITNLNPGEVAVFNESDGVANSVILRNGRIIDITCDVLNIAASTSVNITTPQMTVDASAGVQVNTPAVAMSRDLSIGRNLGVTAATSTNTLSVTSAAANASQMAGGIDAAGVVKSQGISLPGHHHTLTQPGMGNSGGPQ